MKTLVIVAHPDDEVLGMGGTIKKLTKNKNQVKIVIMATGIAARRSTNFKNSSKYLVTEPLTCSMKTLSLSFISFFSSSSLGKRPIYFADPNLSNISM